MKILIVANGEKIPPERLKHEAHKADYIIAADGGAGQLKEIDVLPHLMIGDFDSLEKSVLDTFLSVGVEVRRYPEGKNLSDLELACQAALARGPKAITFAGILGSRSDFSLTNVLACSDALYRNVDIKILEQNSYVLVPLHGPVQRSFTARALSSFSLIPLSATVSGVTISGAKWPLTKAVLKLGSSLSLSNRIVSDSLNIEVASGSLLVRIEECLE